MLGPAAGILGLVQEANTAVLSKAACTLPIAAWTGESACYITLWRELKAFGNAAQNSASANSAKKGSRLSVYKLGKMPFQHNVYNNLVSPGFSLRESENSVHL